MLTTPARLTSGGFGIKSLSRNLRLGGKLTLISDLTAGLTQFAQTLKRISEETQ